MAVSSWYIVVSSSGELVWTGNNFSPQKLTSNSQRNAAAPRRRHWCESNVGCPVRAHTHTQTEHHGPETCDERARCHLALDLALLPSVFVLSRTATLTSRNDWRGRRGGFSTLAPPAGQKVTRAPFIDKWECYVHSTALTSRTVKGILQQFHFISSYLMLALFFCFIYLFICLIIVTVSNFFEFSVKHFITVFLS